MLSVTIEVWGEIPEQIHLFVLLQNYFSGEKKVFFFSWYTPRKGMRKHCQVVNLALT